MFPYISEESEELIAEADIDGGKNRAVIGFIGG